MAENVLGLVFEINADPSKAEAALASFRSKTAAALGGVADSQRNALAVAREAGAEFRNMAGGASLAFGQMSRAAHGWSAVALKVFGEVSREIIRHMELERLSAIHTGKAEAEKTLLTVKAIKEVAAVRAVLEAAKGFAALADYDFWSAAQHFASSALFGGIAAMQIAGLLAGGGRPSRIARGWDRLPETGGAAPAQGGTVPLAAGAASALARPSGQVTVMVVGDTQAAQWIASVVNKGVLQHDLLLYSSHTKHSPQAGR